jgi:hypothetical protein
VSGWKAMETNQPEAIEPLPGQLPLFRVEPTLFGPMEIEPKPKRPVNKRCTPAPSGTGPEGETCKTCRHLARDKHHDYVHLKCGKVEHLWTRGAATDIRSGWAACSEWEEKQ